MAGYLRMSQTIARPIDEVFATAGRLDEYRPYQTIATDDIGKFVALAFDRPEDFIGYELENAGSEPTGLRARYPELQLRTLEDWLREEGWEGKREITVRRDKLGRPLTQT
jgi:hypothetical protein